MQKRSSGVLELPRPRRTAKLRPRGETVPVIFTRKAQIQKGRTSMKIPTRRISRKWSEKGAEFPSPASPITHSQTPCRITGRAGSHGPITTFLYFCNPINHQLHPPITPTLPTPHKPTPPTTAFHLAASRLASTMPMPVPAPTTSAKVRKRCPRQEIWRRWRRKTGKSPKTSMLKRVRLKTWVVLGRREARTVEAITAALVDREAGNLVELVKS